MEKNRKLMKNLVDISVMVTQSTNFFEIKDKIVDKMLEVIEPTKACINLFYDNNFKNAYLVCSSTLDYIPKMFPKNSRIGTKLDFNESYPEYIHEAVRDKKIIYVENIFEDPKAIDERELAKMEGYSGRIVFPIVLNYNVIGFMTCFLTEEDSLEEQEITFISSVVSLVALSIEITLENEHTKELIDKLRESISNINEVTTKLHLNNDVNEFMNYLNTQAQKLTKSEEGFIVIDDLNYDYKIFSAIENKKRKKINFQKILLKLHEYEQNGGYVNDETFLVKVLDSYIKQKSYCEKLINDLNNYKPYINIGQTVAQSDDSISIGAFAKLLNSLGLDIGRNRLFQWFRENGYIMKQNGENQPKQVYIDMGLFQTRQMAITTSEGIAIKVTTYVTGKGQLYFIKKLKGDFLDEEVCGYF